MSKESEKPFFKQLRKLLINRKELTGCFFITITGGFYLLAIGMGFIYQAFFKGNFQFLKTPILVSKEEALHRIEDTYSKKRGRD